MIPHADSPFSGFSSRSTSYSSTSSSPPSLFHPTASLKRVIPTEMENAGLASGSRMKLDTFSPSEMDPLWLHDFSTPVPPSMDTTPMEYHATEMANFWSTEIPLPILPHMGATGCGGFEVPREWVFEPQMCEGFAGWGR